jgi:hypothetical protein
MGENFKKQNTEQERKMEISLKPIEGNSTALIQNAVDACFKCGGGKVILENGTYYISSVRLRSNITLYLKSGVIIRASQVMDDYNIINDDKLEPLPEESRTDVLWTKPRTPNRNTDFLRKPGSRWTNAIFRIAHAKNVNIIGEDGCLIDGRNSYDPIGEEHYRGAHGISMYHSSDMVFEGLTIKDTGNWAFASYFAQNMVFRNLKIWGGHDGVHTSAADNVLVENCVMDTGDDAIAGFDINGMTVRNCVLNSSCSAFRVGGNDILIENCTNTTPHVYGFRGKLSPEDKAASVSSAGLARRTLAFFTYYADFTLTVRNRPSNIVIRNCKTVGPRKLLHFNFSGAEVWQLNRPLADISFENVEALEMDLPVCSYGSADDPITLKFKNCKLGFMKNPPAPIDAVIYAANYKHIDIDGLEVVGADAPLISTWGGDGELTVKGLVGVGEIAAQADTEFTVSGLGGASAQLIRKAENEFTVKGI